ncbi:hypothetical protein OAO01_06595 [Oligoflexia bacterium]|nr:hypothetical protein [Oligoflexia bacterium]
MSNRILISIADFHYWFENRFMTLTLDRHLRKLLSQADAPAGFELHASLEDLSVWVADLKRGRKVLPAAYPGLSRGLQERIFDLRHNALHLCLEEMLSKGDVRVLARLLTAVHKYTGISEFTIHPDLVHHACWQPLLSRLPSPLSLSVENMDCRKRCFRALTELAELLIQHPRLQCTFDTSHWLEHKRALDAPELLQFLKIHRQRVSKIHFSVPTSKAAAYLDSQQIKTSHYLQVRSGVACSESFFQALNYDLPFVIEGLVPVGNFSLLLDEARELRLQLNRSQRLHAVA